MYDESFSKMAHLDAEPEELRVQRAECEPEEAGGATLSNTQVLC